MSYKRMYNVKFIEYTSCFRDAVWSEKLDKYFYIEDCPVLIAEDEIEYYSKFGKGIESLEFVGNYYFEDSEEDSEDTI